MNVKPLILLLLLGADSGRLVGFLTRAKVSESTVRTLLASGMFATASASQSGEKFPLVLVAQGNGQDVFDQVVLCEFLASYGFVVATTPSPMLLHFYEELDEFMKPDFSLIRGLRFESVNNVRLEGMYHVHFTTDGLAVNRFQDLATLTRAVDGTAREAALVYRTSKAILKQKLQVRK